VREPRHVFVAPDGSLYLTDPRKRAVLRYDANFVWQGAVEPGGARLEAPVAAVADERGRVWIADGERRVVLLLAPGEPPREIGGRGGEPGRFDRLTDIAVDADGYVHAADPARRRVQTFSPGGLLERAISGFGTAAFQEPTLVAVDRARRVYVYDRGRQVIVAGDPDGTLAWEFPTQEHVDGRDDLADLDVDAQGTVWLVSRERRAALALSRAGVLLATYFGREARPVRFERPIAIAAGREGALVVLDAEDRRIQEFTVTYPGNPAPLAAARRAHVAETLAPTSDRPVAVARAAGNAPERWLWRTAAGLSLGDPSAGPTRPAALPGGVPERVVATGTDQGFVVVAQDERIVLLDRDGRIAGSIPNETAGGLVRRPRALAWRADDGALAVYDVEDDDLLLLGPDGTFLRRIGRRGVGPGEVQDVIALAFDAEGRLLVADQKGARLQAFDRFGVLTAESPWAPGGTRMGPFAGMGTDAWGRLFLLDGVGIVLQLDDEGRVDCQGGDPRRSRDPAGLVVAPDGVAYVLGGREAGGALPFRCAGPPPRPRAPWLGIEPGARPRVVVRWAPVPGATSYEVLRETAAGGWEVLGRASEPLFAMPDRAGRPAGVAVVGVDQGGRRGTASAATLDRISPALGALEAGRPAEAEPLLAAAIEEARASGSPDPAVLAALVGARARVAAALGQYDRALAIVEQELAPIAPQEVPAAQAAIYREGATAALALGDGEIALQWLQTLTVLPGAELTPVERRALDLAGRGDPPTAALLLTRYGHHGSALDGARLAAAVAEVQVSLGRPREALTELAAAAAATTDPALRQELEAQLFQTAERALEAAADTSLLQPVEAYAAGLDPARAQAWAPRLGALRAKPAILEAIALEGSDFAAARAALQRVLTETGGLLVDDEIRVRAHLGALALAQGDTAEARSQFAAAIALRPDWDPDPDEYSPTVRAFVEQVRSGTS
jgi:tetratricopeptide (TPR) repeat protein